MINSKEAKRLVSQGATLVDVRTPEEYEQGHLPDALLINSAEIEHRLVEFGQDKEKCFVLYCKSGGRSGFVTEILTKLGFKNVHNAGGYEDLKGEFA